MSFVWTPDLSVGVESIDIQHQELFLRVNALLAVVKNGPQEQEVLQMLAFLGDYIVRHFEDEEQLMQKTGYPGLARQLAEHQQLMAAFKRLRTKFARHGIDAMLAKDVEGEVCDWLVRHVQVTDRALGEWIAGGNRAERTG
jgi:hemerythrin